MKLALQLFLFAGNLVCYGVGAVATRLFSKSPVALFIGGVIGIFAFTGNFVLRVRGGWGNPTLAGMIAFLVLPTIAAGIGGPLVTTLMTKFPGTTVSIALVLTIVFFFAFGRP